MLYYFNDFTGLFIDEIFRFCRLYGFNHHILNLLFIMTPWFRPMRSGNKPLKRLSYS
jgi:hypothetical protein